jgi:hypothetical protein
VSSFKAVAEQDRGEPRLHLHSRDIRVLPRDMRVIIRNRQSCWPLISDNKSTYCNNGTQVRQTCWGKIAHLDISATAQGFKHVCHGQSGVQLVIAVGPGLISEKVIDGNGR